MDGARCTASCAANIQSFSQAYVIKPRLPLTFFIPSVQFAVVHHSSRRPLRGRDGHAGGRRHSKMPAVGRGSWCTANTLGAWSIITATSPGETSISVFYSPAALCARASCAAEMTQRLCIREVVRSAEARSLSFHVFLNQMRIFCNLFMIDQT